MKVIIKSILCLLFLSKYIVNSIYAKGDAKAADGVKVEGKGEKKSENTGKDVTYKLPTAADCKGPKEFSEEEKKQIDEEAIAKKNNDSELENKLNVKYKNNDVKDYKKQYEDYIKNIKTNIHSDENNKVNANDLAKNPTDIVDYKLQKTNKGCY